MDVIGIFERKPRAELMMRICDADDKCNSAQRRSIVVCLKPASMPQQASGEMLRCGDKSSVSGCSAGTALSA